MERKLHLYTTVGCHLCEMAESILDPIADRDQIIIERVEIADSDALLERYGVRIPVIRPHGSTLELGWPFDAEAVELLLKQAYS